MRPYFFQGPPRAGRTPKAQDEAPRLVGVVRRSDDEHDLALLSVGQRYLRMEGGAGVEPRTGPARQARAVQCSRVGQRAVASDELGTAAADGTSWFAHLGEDDPAGVARGR